MNSYKECPTGFYPSIGSDSRHDRRPVRPCHSGRCGSGERADDAQMVGALCSPRRRRPEACVFAAAPQPAQHPGRGRSGHFVSAQAADPGAHPRPRTWSTRQSVGCRDVPDFPVGRLSTRRRPSTPQKADASLDQSSGALDEDSWLRLKLEQSVSTNPTVTHHAVL